MEELIWNPASNDSTGIQAFYQRNKNNYSDSTTIEIAIFEFELSIVDGRIMEYYEPGGENDVGGYKLVDLERLNNIVYFVEYTMNTAVAVTQDI